ncbi:MAG: hypothetical protein IT359_14935 [Gemmatimonadaceae bacterium]|nr:hypothetical protein [Gemmatimonadaceae bacterium]
MVIVPPHTTSQASARSRALAARLRTTIADFQAREPKVTREEIAQALHEVQPPSQGRSANMAGALVATIAGLTIAIGIGLLVSIAQKTGSAPPPIVLISLAAVLVAAVVAVVIKARRDD